MKFNLFILTLGLMIFASCKKASTTADPVVLTPEQLLTAKTWKADEIRVQQSNNIFIFYTRGGTTNTTNYDADSIKYNANNTGVYYTGGSQITTTWNFTNSEKTKMNLTINYPTSLNLKVENIYLTANSFSFSQYYTYGGINFVGYGHRIPN